jgi:hypothetical protein
LGTRLSLQAQLYKLLVAMWFSESEQY